MGRRGKSGGKGGEGRNGREDLRPSPNVEDALTPMRRAYLDTLTVLLQMLASCTVKVKRLLIASGTVLLCASSTERS